MQCYLGISPFLINSEFPQGYRAVLRHVADNVCGYRDSVAWRSHVVASLTIRVVSMCLTNDQDRF